MTEKANVGRGHSREGVRAVICIELTREIREQLAAVEAVVARHVPGRDSFAEVEIPKLRLADLVLEQTRRQQLLPRKARVVRAYLAPRRRRRA